MKGTQRGESGHAVVIQGVPGSGKTALLNEYALRLLTAQADAERPVIPVPLKSGTMNSPPTAVVEEIELRQACSSENEVVRAVQAALSVRDEGRKKPQE